MSDTQLSVDSYGFQEPARDSSQSSVELAPWAIRVYAKLIDSAVVWGTFTVLYLVGMYVTARGHSSLGRLFYIVSYVEAVFGWCWVIYETGTTGQSIGKRVMRTRLVWQNGLPLGFWHALLHETLQLFVDVLPIFIGYLWPLIDKRRQTFSDKIMGTRTFRVQS